MRKILLGILILFCCLFYSHSSLAQLSTVGKEFWVGFMDNNRILPDAPDQAVIVISANEDAVGVIEYRGRAIPFNLSQGQQFTHTIPSQELDMLHRGSGVVEDKGIYISSNGKIAVYAFNERFRSADGTVVLPLGALGRDYLITSHYEFLTAPVSFQANVNDESELLVIATEDDTEIEITSSVNAYSGVSAGVPYSITLNRGQSYQLKAKADLTGTRVKVIGENADNCKKIAVFGGNKWTTVGDCGGAPDNLFQQTYPINSWGTSFVHVALNGRTSGELVKILASEDDTQVTIGGQNRGTINTGEFLSIEFGINQTAKIETSKPSSVTVFAKSQECNEPNDPNFQNGDPFMISYSPSEQLLKDIRFTALSLPSIVNHYLNLVVKSGTENLTFLDGQNVATRFAPVPGDPNFSYARISISPGVHRIVNSEGFIGYVYGFGFIESYGFAVGAALDNLNFETESSYEFEVEGDNVACLNQEGIWSIESENPNYTYFEWDFGDGSDIKVGKEVAHTYTEPGEYEILVKASISPNSCEEQEEITIEVEVLEINNEAEIVGVFSVCPDVEELIYKLSDTTGISKIDFSIEGGEIIENYGDSILVNWGPANNSAKILAVPYTANGCPGETISKEVIINTRLEAEAPVGQQQVCFDNNVSHFYSVPSPSPGRGYDWNVIGGSIITTLENGIVEVVWDQPGIVGEVSYTVSSLIDNSCAGESPSLAVSVAESFEVIVGNNPSISCFGESGGEIELVVVGGVEPYDIIWSHDPELKQLNAGELGAGTYSVKIIDQLGCEVFLENIEVVEPEILEIITLNAQATSCYGKADGILNLQISGGTAPYTFEYEGLQTFMGILNLTDMPQGEFSWEIKDANGCIIPIEFEITSPPALEVEVRMEKPACPGGSNGELFAFPEGGKGPYVYSWEDPLGFGNQLIGVPRGNYNISVRDLSGCISIGVGEVKEAAPVVRMPTGFNPSSSDELFQGVSNCEIDFELWIYNRWGQLIYSGPSGWDGLISGNEAPSGSYSYLMSYSFPIEGEIQTIEKRGAFTLIR
ncbi:PKD domain-containing protein [Algoriphagus sp.]|uniref:PKD domain-containing protein n=1 Tax=Algoriphagus sp. TaxID=1872435 RepID=UPI0025E45052|nr:PKD domain-containing protein [Algoriphagus sp.]